MEMLKPIKRSKIKFNLDDSNVPSKLPKEVQSLVKDLADVAMYVKAYKEIGVDDDAVPFGRIKKEVVLDAKKILDELSVKIKEKKTREEARFKEDSIKADRLADSKLKNQQELQSLAEEISRLSSEYYQLLPKVS